MSIMSRFLGRIFVVVVLCLSMAISADAGSQVDSAHEADKPSKPQRLRRRLSWLQNTGATHSFNLSDETPTKTISFGDFVINTYWDRSDMSMSMPTSSPGPTPVPTSNLPQLPTPLPTSPPTGPPITAPTPGPSPTPVPTEMPSLPLTLSPTIEAPSTMPTMADTTLPPTPVPTVSIPTVSPTTLSPTQTPTTRPSTAPTLTPSDIPTSFPSSFPTQTCNLSEEDRAILIRSFLDNVSDPADLDEDGSPQNLAMRWLIDEDTAYLCPQDDTLIQRYVVAVFYYSTEGDDWRECSAPSDFDDPISIAMANEACMIEVEGSEGSNAWLGPSSECLYGGLVCNSAGWIDRVDLETNEVSGTLPAELGRLRLLRFLLVEDGLLTGTIPAEIGNLDLLRELDFNKNSLSGSIPEAIYDLSNLRELDLDENLLTGSISTRIEQLSQLAFLQVNINEMTGMIPDGIGNLFLLEIATFDNNNFSGSVPDLLCQNRSGLLELVTADCLGAPGRPSPPYVSCTCCTCF